MRIDSIVMACVISAAGSTWAGPAHADTDRNAEDAAITIQVQRQLASAAPAATHLELSTRNGIVTMAGRVDSEAMRQRVVSLAVATDGVIGVNDQLVIVPPPPLR
jgi:osmotically-inducible protein OsmY